MGTTLVQRLLEPGEIEALDHTSIPRVLLPQSAALFTARAARLRQLAAGAITGIPVEASLSGYLLLMATLVDAQRTVSAAMPEGAIALPAAATIALSHEHNMPLIPISGDRPPVWRTIFASLLDQLDNSVAAQPQLAPVLAELRALDADALEAAANAVLDEDSSNVNPMHAPFIAAALQVLWTVQASEVSPARVPTLETATLCPLCGSHPVASVIRIGGQSQGYRYLQCGICSSEWHMVRVKCSTCESNAKINYQSLDPVDAVDFAVAEGGKVSLESLAKTAAQPANKNKANDPKKVARAETCDDCHTYRKIFNQEHDYHVEPLADDLASLLLDMLVTEAGYERASGNPLLWFGTAS
jgi:FdhE protein